MPPDAVRVNPVGPPVGLTQNPAVSVPCPMAVQNVVASTTHAIAVDLESHRVARAAERLRVPFLVFRVIADPADRDLPPAALVPLTRSGRPSPRVLGSIATKPRQLSALLALARETRSALEALRRGAVALGAALRHT